MLPSVSASVRIDNVIQLLTDIALNLIGQIPVVNYCAFSELIDIIIFIPNIFVDLYEGSLQCCSVKYLTTRMHKLKIPWKNKHTTRGFL